MAMTVELPHEIAAYVRAEVAEGAAADEVQFLSKAVELYRELKTRHEDLRARIEKSSQQAERGDAAPLDTEATKAEARRRFEQQE